MDYAFEINGLIKAYEGKEVLNVDKLAFEKNKITAMIGPSGAGKSTLLSILNCLEKPDRGEVKFDNISLRLDKGIDTAARRKMAMVLQKPTVFNDTVYNNLIYGLKLRGGSKQHLDSLAMAMLKRTGLENMGRQTARTLSGGEAQRIAVARAVVLRPEVLMLDEPTANLDPANIAIIEEIIKSANKDYGTTIIVVTHNLFQARRIADNVVFLMDGKVVESGRAADVLDNPGDKRTMDFISGKMIY